MSGILYFISGTLNICVWYLLYELEGRQLAQKGMRTFSLSVYPVLQSMVLSIAFFVVDSNLFQELMHLSAQFLTKAQLFQCVTLSYSKISKIMSGVSLR